MLNRMIHTTFVRERKVTLLALLMIAGLGLGAASHAAATELYSTPLFNDASLISYYRMEGNSNDAKSSNNGSDSSMSYSTTSGKFGEGASF